MRLAAGIVFYLLVSMPCLAQSHVIDLSTLVGKKAIAQRMPFYQPGTFRMIPSSYAGQTVTILAVKPSAMFAIMPQLTAGQMAGLPQQSRDNIENARNASTFVVQFADGTKADTGALPVMPSNLASYLEIVPVLPEAAPTTVLAMVPISNEPPQDCPIIVTKAASTDGGFGHTFADALTKSQYERALEKANNGGNDPHYLDVRMRNAGNKEVRAVEAYALYANAMGDKGETMTLLTQNDKSIKPGGEYKSYAVDTSVRSSNGKGDVKVYVTRVRFEDDTFWQDNGSHSCFLTSRVK